MAMLLRGMQCRTTAGDPPQIELTIGAADQPLPAAGHPRQRNADSRSAHRGNPAPHSISPAFPTSLMAIMRSKL